MELRSVRALDAVIGPEALLPSGRGDYVVWLAAGVGGGEGDVAGRVPVLREDDVLEAPRDAVDRRDHGIAVGYGQRAAGAEIVLHIGDEQDVASGDFHLCLLCREPRAEIRC